MPYFHNKHAAITGAGSGIGRALALQLNEQGCALWLSDVDEEGLMETRSLLPRPDIACDTRRVDVADQQAVEAWAEAVSASHGALDLVVNNAGVALGAEVKDMAMKDFHWLMDINFWGVVHGTQAFLPLLEKAPRGHLVNLSSMFGLIGVPTQAAYNAAKFAVRGYSEALRQELEIAGSNVAVCCVHPGGVGTNIARNARSSDPSADAEARHENFSQMVRTSAEDAAAQILRAAERRKARLLIGSDARFVDWLVRLTPVHYGRIIHRRFRDLRS